MIEVADTPLGIEVRLRNLEYDLTSNIQRVVYGFQSLDAVLAALEQPANLTLYLSSETMPEMMAGVSTTLQDVTREIAEGSQDKVIFEVVDMSAPDVGISEQDLLDSYQIQPVATSFFSLDTFYLHLVIEAGDDIRVIYPSGDLSQAEIRNAIESALKRSSSGFLKVVGLWSPPAQGVDQFGRQMPSLQQYSILEETLRESYELRRVTLEEGQIPADIDVLILLAPHSLSDLQRYAIDQYMMRGGSLIVAGGHYRLGIDPYSGALKLDANENGDRGYTRELRRHHRRQPGDGLSERAIPAAGPTRFGRYGRQRDSGAGLPVLHRCASQWNGRGKPGGQQLATSDDDLGIAGLG